MIKDTVGFIDAATLKDILRGFIPLGAGFVFAESPQGHDYWKAQADSGLTDKGRATLEEWIAEIEAAEE